MTDLHGLGDETDDPGRALSYAGLAIVIVVYLAIIQGVGRLAKG